MDVSVWLPGSGAVEWAAWEMAPVLADKGTLCLPPPSPSHKELGLTHVWPLQHVVRVRRKGKTERRRKKKKVGEG